MDHLVRSRVVRVGILAGLLAAALPGMASAGTISALWGWVTARQPTTASYTPAAKDQGNSSGGTNTVEHLGTGRYQVSFGGLDPIAGCSGTNGCGGMAMVTAMSQSQRICTVGDFGGSLPVNVLVDCRDGGGADADSGFSVNFVAARGPNGTMAYLYADQPTTASYDPAAEYNYNSISPQSAHIERQDVGYYRVQLTGMLPNTAGNLQVNGSDARCRIDGRKDHNTPGDIYGSVFVRCVDLLRNAADSPFFLTYTDGIGLKGMINQPAAYLFANKKSAASYQPSAALRYSSAGQVPTVTRSGVGTYRATLYGLPLGGSAQVTSYGPGKAECQLTGIRKSGNPQRIGVKCFKPNGSLTDSQFYLTFTR